MRRDRCRSWMKELPVWDQMNMESLTRFTMIQWLCIASRALVVDIEVSHVVEVEVVHVGLVLEQVLATLFAETQVLGREGLVDVQNGGILLVQEGTRLGLPDDGVGTSILRGDAVGRVQSRVLERGARVDRASRSNGTYGRDLERVALNPELNDDLLGAIVLGADRLEQEELVPDGLELDGPFQTLGGVEDIDELSQVVLDNRASRWGFLSVQLPSLVIIQGGTCVL